MKNLILTNHYLTKSGLILMLFLAISCHTLTAQKMAKNAIQLTHDNDVFKLKNATDRYYSFGLGAMFQQALKAKSIGFLPTNVFRAPDNKYLWGVELSLKGYTPDNSDDSLQSFNHRPFAGTLTLAPHIISVNQDRLVKLALEMGVRGPAAQAGDLQNWIHRLIGDDFVEGWDNQLDNKVLLNLYLDFAKPFNVSRILEIIPESSVGLGNHKTYVQQAIKLRIGKFNSIANTIAYATNLGGKYKNEMFATISAYGRVSFVDATWSNEQVLREDLPRIDKNNLLGGFQAYIHASFSRVGISLGYNKVTPGSDFSVKHSYGTLTLRYKW